MATCLLYANQTLLGWADLRPTDPSMGVVSGAFHPYDAYVTVQPVIWNVVLHSDYASAQTPDGVAAYAAKEALDLRISTDAGEPLQQTGPIWLDDIPDQGPEPLMELSVMGVPWGVLEAIFGCDASDPW